MTAKGRNSIMLGLAAILILALAGTLYYTYSKDKAEKEAQQQQVEQLKLEIEQTKLQNEYENLNTDYQNLESQTQYLKNDSLLDKYTEAKHKVEKLLAELKSQKITSSRRISELQGEIKTLKGIMRHYVEVIDSLGRENAGLRAENVQIKATNELLNNRVNEVAQKNEHLSKRMVLAEKMNITGLTLTTLKSNGKSEKKITKCKQLKVTFTITPNNSTPAGEKTLYVRITNPEGTLLGSHGSFKFEGSSIPYTDKKTIEYTGQEVPGVSIFWNVNTVLNPGTYTVEVFADNYRLGSRTFTYEK